MRHELERRKAEFAYDEDPFDELPIAVLILVDGELVRSNDGWTSLTGLDWRRSIGDQWLLGLHDADREAARQLIDPDRGERIRVGELRVRPVDQPSIEVWVHARSRFVGDVDSATCVITLTEIGARKAHELRLLHLATHDPATGLLNRERFVAELEALLARPEDETHLAALFIDLDRFKEINDGHGHAFGDVVLAEAAQRLRSSVRPTDTIARIGGDEFAILLPDLERHADAAHFADRIIATLSAPLVVGDRSVAVGASIGIAVSSREHSAGALVDLADRAMYQSKTAGGSRWTFAEVTPSPGQSSDRANANEAAPGESEGQPIGELVHHCHVALTATESAVLTVVGQLDGERDATAAETVRRLFEQLWSVVADANTPGRAAS